MEHGEVDTLGESILSSQRLGDLTNSTRRNGHGTRRYLGECTQVCTDFIESYFRIKERRSNIKLEFLCGILHYVSCIYILTIIPKQLENAQYEAKTAFFATAFCTGLGSIVGGLLTNLPFVIAPVTCVSIFLSVFLQEKVESGNMPAVGNTSLLISGGVLILLGWKPLDIFITKFIPIPIQVGTVVGIGLITAMAGATELDLIQDGNSSNTLLEIGPMTSAIYISAAAFLVLIIGLHYHVKGSFVMALIFGSIVYWWVFQSWPDHVAADSWSNVYFFSFNGLTQRAWSFATRLTVDMFFLYVLYLNGLVLSLATLAGLVSEDGTVPRSGVVFLVCGSMTILSAFLSGAPVLISPESAAGIKAGARTGFSAVVAGILFLLTTFFQPLFSAIPAAGSSPILAAIGVVMFQNVLRLDWCCIKEAAPAFGVLFFIPLTYSVLNGLMIGYIIFIGIEIFTEDVQDNIKYLMTFYLLPDDIDNESTILSSDIEPRFGIGSMRPSIMNDNTSLSETQSFSTANELQVGIGHNERASGRARLSHVGSGSVVTSSTYSRRQQRYRYRGIVMNMGYPEIPHDDQLRNHRSSFSGQHESRTKSAGGTYPSTDGGGSSTQGSHPRQRDFNFSSDTMPTARTGGTGSGTGSGRRRNRGYGVGGLGGVVISIFRAVGDIIGVTSAPSGEERLQTQRQNAPSL